MRNLPYKLLNNKEKAIVRKHYLICMSDKSMECHKLHKNIKDFWEAHRIEDSRGFLKKRAKK